ncbi:calmodulin-lysine N-methyltransferase isoform X2 [Nilaparvata lugens]|uniref:calmodulin-lysine N-methyltransferase isoform X2 n=1 Tax=Nilaparvata lugens TaxID=108931 RepID=UPI000B993E81|nr:calmodulin-lysine N-methyltransferase isoform X2 [Nilaparvata lugens]XP_022184816.1 calmodulin-lysine N-methyltransferase isoform X2 [Nilaparvata lugens]XP_022184818.1 calmodulin-lysine N-methyltransferase isoform X2 [Nilaparvata lugens]XP_039281274.1 calmodulin-lysine N-methyltransferase isoform X2 [Nilaparvata lugens]XP_039281275.1 calmodulin-lysine N-methyltransferase isoform X2 [Nilaparvata lugens]
MQQQEQEGKQAAVAGGGGGGGGGSDPHEMARRRWRMLARALHRRREQDKLDMISVRRISSFGLLTLKPDADDTWFEYSAHVNGQLFTVLVRHVVQEITPTDLMGFNNTGNVCVWPSEEVLAYYVLCNRDFFQGKMVLELGGGMTCLAGLLIAKFTHASFVRLTDGNTASVENVARIVKRNDLHDSPRVDCCTLQWGNKPLASQPLFDVVLAADCLFFDDARKDLVATMRAAIKADGEALVTAPRRGSTLNKFIVEAEQSGFVCTILHYYNHQVWQRHLQLSSDSPDYDEDIHYPLLIHLIKKQPD